MKNKNKFGSVLVLVLLVTVGLLATGVAYKMRKTAVSAQAIERPPAATTVSDAPSAEAPVAVFIGDFTGGSAEGGVGDKNWTSILTADIQKTKPLRAVVDNSGGGSGYVVRGPSPTFADQVRRLVTPDARVVAISGSRNDVVAKPNQVTSDALETYSLVQSLAPRAKLIVIGPTWGNSEPTDQILQTRDSVRDAAASVNAYFVDPIEDRWFTNGEPGLVGSDNMHPTDLANARIAEHLYPIFGQALIEDTG
jgi:GDSL-like Lipase/Acylhydrolase family